MNNEDKIRKFPKQEKRVETGPIQFGDDWPGVFIRGDNAAYYAFTLKSMIEYKRKNGSMTIEDSVLVGLLSDLASCIVGSDSEIFKLSE